MAGDWYCTTLGAIAVKDDYGLVDGPFGSNLPASSYTECGVPVIRGSNLTLGASQFRADDFVFVSQATAARLSRSLCRPFDIVFTKKGTLGQTGLVPDGGPYDLYLLSSNQMKLTVDEELADPLFVYYYVSSRASARKIVQDSEATGVPKTNLAYLRDFPITLPPLPEQRAIAHILGTLDDKIELNRRMNETLEEMARTLFKSWFVDFDPVHAKAEGRDPGLPQDLADLFPDSFAASELGEIPTGWRIEALDAIAHYQNGLALQKYRPIDGEDRLPVVKIAQLRSGRPDSDEWAAASITPNCIIDDGDIVFSWSGSLMVRVWSGGRAALNQHLFKVTSARFPKWFILHSTLFHLPEFQRIAADKATTMGHIKRQHLSDAKCVTPDDGLLSAVDGIFASLLDRRISASLESRTLESLRDALLPKLISGDLRIADAGKCTETRT